MGLNHKNKDLGLDIRVIFYLGDETRLLSKGN
jgi:hypothetical protein